MRTRKYLLSMILMSLSVIVGCSGVTLGPQVRTDLIVVYPGRPCQVMENAKVLVKPLADDKATPVKKDIGGWAAMPIENWDAIKDRLIELQKFKDDSTRR